MTPLLTPADPPPVEVVTGSSGWLITCEHAGHAVPARLGDLGLAASELTRHIGWDPGAGALAAALSDRLDATLVAQPYSRLVIDCNRPRGAPDLCAAEVDGTVVPANSRLDEAAKQARWDAIHQPYHDCVAALLDSGRFGAFVSVHSYDPQRRCDPVMRPWPVGLLWRKDNPLVDHLVRGLAGEAAAQPLGFRQPYRIGDDHDVTLPRHPEPRAMPHVLIEIRNDHLRRPEAIFGWAGILARHLAGFPGLERPGP